MFIAIEWVDWSGKDTQLKLLLGYLIDQDKHRIILKSREPSRMTQAGKRLNEIAQQHIETSALETAELFAWDRRELQSFRKTLLDQGIWIVSSRCDLSTYAYQGYTMGLGFEKVWELHQDILAPDVTIFLTISPETMMNRLKDRWDVKNEVYEQEDFLRKCHGGYKQAIPFLREKGRNIIEIDGEGSAEEVFWNIKRMTNDYLKL